MVVRFVCVIRVPVCARAPRVCPVCVPAPPGVFLPVLVTFTLIRPLDTRGMRWRIRLMSSIRSCVGGVYMYYKPCLVNSV